MHTAVLNAYMYSTPVGYSRFQVTGMIKWEPKKSLGLPTQAKKKKPMPNLQALKISRKDCTLFTKLRCRGERALSFGYHHKSSNYCVEYP